MKKTIALLVAGVLGGLGYYMYKKKDKKEKVVVDERSLAKDSNDYTIYFDEEEPKQEGEEMFV
jgi:hypothetical protein